VEKIDGPKIYSVLTGRIDGEIHVEARSLYIKVGVEHFLEHVKRSGETMERPYNP
jgi:hypothetical protein